MMMYNCMHWVKHWHWPYANKFTPPKYSFYFIPYLCKFNTSLFRSLRLQKWLNLKYIYKNQYRNVIAQCVVQPEIEFIKIKSRWSDISHITTMLWHSRCDSQFPNCDLWVKKWWKLAISMANYSASCDGAWKHMGIWLQSNILAR